VPLSRASGLAGSGVPLLDAFGTRIDPDALRTSLVAAGLDVGRVSFEDDGVELAVAPATDEVVAQRAATALRAALSPLLPVRRAVLDAAGEGAEPGVSVVDARLRHILRVGLVEVTAPREQLSAALAALLVRAGEPPPQHGAAIPRTQPSGPPVTGDRRIDPIAPALLPPLLAALGAGASEASPTLSLLGLVRGEVVVAGPAAALPAASAPRGPHLLAFRRDGGGERGVRPALLLAMSWHIEAVARLAGWLATGADPAPRGSELLLDGLVWSAGRRPTVAAWAGADQAAPIAIDAARCLAGCTVCADLCPTAVIERPVPDGEAPRIAAPDACVRCQDCVEACPADAIRPTYAADAATRTRALVHRAEWLTRLRGAAGPAVPAPFPPSFLMPRARAAAASHAPPAPRYILGLAVVTAMEHAAVLWRDGELLGGIEKERISRLRHHGWSPPGRPGVTLAVDPTIALEEVLCRGPIRALLETEGITLDDVDVFALNGLPARYRRVFSHLDDTRDIPSVRAGRVLAVPHHLCHAASTLRASGADSGWIFTVDGRGDRETAAVFRADEGEISSRRTLLSLEDASIGGVYETVTRLLGFGTHGQGSVMALGAMGEPGDDLSAHLHVAPDGAATIHESGLAERFADRARGPSAPLEAQHVRLAASLQRALEESALALVGAEVGAPPIDALCLAGGVALNCAMNNALRLALRPGLMFVQPGANDAGTALGAALEAAYQTTGARGLRMEHAYLGPAFDEVAIERELRRSGLAYERCADIADEVARRLAEGQVICWFQGAMEFGPRALGHRSILADPRDPGTKDRVNAIKTREPWRPFGPSMLAGHEADWIEAPFDTRFMLFTLPVVADKRARIPAVLHVDGTTRPQIVHADTSPRYHALISAFYERTGVPMVLNTSFNRRGEPIVCTPADAVDSFLGLGADVLAIGDFLVERPTAPARVAQQSPGVAELTALAGAPRGRRLALRLTTTCNLSCAHCTLADLPNQRERSHDEALRALAEGRRSACDEVVFLRGEPALRADLPELIGAARRMGYRWVQLQSNAAALGEPGRLAALLAVGIDAIEAYLPAGTAEEHDAITRAPGSFARAVRGLGEAAAAPIDLLVSVPLLRSTLRSLPATLKLAARLGASRLQLGLPRPIELADRLVADDVPRLSEVAPILARLLPIAEQLGLTLSTEALPHCHLPPALHGSPDATEDWARHRIDDLHLVHDAVSDVRRTQRPDPPPCRGCSARDACPRTWALYLELFGSDELRPLGGGSP
jgi:predicted NodU family carbamoyl transferase/MoaA/NifB/PqqE/SkfB family radical SAM enzyme/ferredoxin